MPGRNPTPRQSHVDALLTNISEAFTQDATNFVADKVFPIVPVEKQSDKYYKISRGDFWRDSAMKRAPGTESAGVGYTPSTDVYFCEKWALHKDIDEDTRANTDSQIEPEKQATNLVTTGLLIRRERLFLSSFFTTGVWTNDLTGTVATNDATHFIQWDQVASNPLTDIDAWSETIFQRTGLMPNVLLVGPKVFRILKNHSVILARIQYTQRAIITEELLASFFGVQKFLVARGIYNASAEGVADSLNFMAGKHALLCYAAPAPGLEVATGGYIFAWKGLLGANAYGGRMKKFWIDPIESDRIEGEMAIAMKLMAADLGVFFNGAVA